MTDSAHQRKISAGRVELGFPIGKSVFIPARDLPPEKRHAAEILLGGALAEDEFLLLEASKGSILKPAFT